MKKFVCLLLVIVILLAFIGCSKSESESEPYDTNTTDRFIRVYRDFNNAIYVDKETNVLYFWHCGGYAGGLSMMLDENGKPLLWEKTNE